MNPPCINDLKGKITVLERRLAHLDQRVKSPDRKQSSRDYDLAEAAAVRGALECMRFVAQSRGGA